MLSGDTLVGGLIRRGGRGRLRRGGATFPLNELPEEVLVSVFDAVGDLDWVRRTVPFVCKAWDELYRSRDARSLHETIKLDFRGEVESAARKREKERARQRKWEAGGWGSEDKEDWGGGGWCAFCGEWHGPHGFDPWAVIPWAERRAGSVRRLLVSGFVGGLDRVDPDDRSKSSFS